MTDVLLITVAVLLLIAFFERIALVVGIVVIALLMILHFLFAGVIGNRRT